MGQFSLFSMFWNAGLMVKFVMLLLLFFSFGSWYIIFQKHMLYKKIRIDSQTFLKMFWGSKSLSDAHKASSDYPNSTEAAVFRIGYSELQKIKASKASGEKERSLETRFAGIDNLNRALLKAESNELNRLTHNLSFLATTGSATPFIGLFGTVWGIMASFHEIGRIGSASLAVVAPGISEALVATAAGLAVAIPAVIFYNYFSNQVDELDSEMRSFSADFLNLVERDLIAKK